MKWLFTQLSISAALILSISCADTEPPIILDTTLLYDTADSLGPYEVIATVSDEREVRAVYLYFGNGDADTPEAELARREMEKISDESFSAEIPGFPPGTNIIYFVVAQDLEGNKDRDPESDYYSFRILTQDTE